MESSYENTFDQDAPVVRELSKGQRRALGVLIEKAFTTPDQYPLTLKALTNGANQKSNRDPVTNYSEDSIWELLDQLRELGLIAVVHTESGRTERYRHYMRRRFPFSEPQLAIIAELMLRGRQQLGELRSRASRMVPIASLDDLRRELASLQEQGFIQSSGGLERRGIEVDHALYTEEERARMTPVLSAESSRETELPQQPQAAPAPEAQPELISELRAETAVLRSEVESLRSTLDELRDDLAELRQSLGA